MTSRRSDWIALCALALAAAAFFNSLRPDAPVAAEGLPQPGAAPLTQITATPTPSPTPFIPRTFVYQGFVRRSTGSPANGLYNIQIAIYDRATGGTPLYTESLTNAPILDGLLTLTVGATTPIGPTVFSGGPRYLGVTIAPDGEMQPRQPIQAVPWALVADTARALASGATSESHWTFVEIAGESTGLYAESYNGNGIEGYSGSGGIGVQGISSSGRGVYGLTDSGIGVVGNSGNGSGMSGSSTSGYGVEGFSNTSHGVYGSSNGETTSGAGVYGASLTGTGIGVYGTSSSNNAVRGDTDTYDAVLGNSTAGHGVRGISGSANGMFGSSTGRYGVAAVSTNSWGIYSEGGTGGVYAFNRTNNYTAYLGSSCCAGYFAGPTQIVGTLTKSAGSFKIDHPLDPANKYLSHSFVESPDMMNIYNGNVTLDKTGEAWVQLPDWFGPLNRDFRYQLTALGAPGPTLHIAQEIADNRFKIAGGAPGAKVSWQVTGIRHDPYAEQHRIVVEEDKPADERGTYLHPDAHGLPKEQGATHALQKRLPAVGTTGAR